MSYSGLGLLSITIYFLLNLLVTVTSKQLVTSTLSPYLLTACHAFTTFITTSVLSRLRSVVSSTANPRKSPQSSHDESRLPLRTHAILLAFSLVYTVNIGMSNLSLGLVSLAMHQTIRALAPAITVLLTIVVLNRPLSFYPLSIYLSLIPTIFGVALATVPSSATASASHDSNGRPENTHFGIALTFIGAILAVGKTMITHQLQQPRSSSPSPSRMVNIALGLSAVRLVKYLSPYAVAQALCFAYLNGELKFQHPVIQLPMTALVTREPGGRVRVGTLAIVNVLSASALNIASFEANRRCGALSMGVAGNLKQVVILLLASLRRRGGGDDDGSGGNGGHQTVPEGRVVLGTLMTAAGGMWYAWATSRMKDRSFQARV
ncbi:hypothetical protein PV08_00926 [Exophiala spinifera]|uniref:Sugar phosphate transporter domain-containing protein n=1 Tax=Exophiala spinifera TaxID=91928 RepID=A0A0D1YYI6_9EURO|nr:uncharacterized protein PV08_00926 [Exophiala spinifera]KIW20351.1 hypothetical protein PV08_00926 [Exophiala spinifera]